MKALKDYIRSEWLIWVGTFVFLFALSALNAALANGIMTRTSNEIAFVQDKDAGWYAGYKTNWSYIGEHTDTLRPVWKGQVGKYPAVVTVARNKSFPGASYRLIVVMPTGGVKSMRAVIKEKPYSIMVTPGYPITRIYFNGKVEEYNIEKD